jgi:hypothetical protein
MRSSMYVMSRSKDLPLETYAPRVECASGADGAEADEGVEAEVSVMVGPFWTGWSTQR